MRRHLFLGAVLAAVCTASGQAQDKPAGKAGKGDGSAQMQQKLLQQFDANKDGVLNDQEKLAANEYLRRMGVLGGVEPGGFPAFEQFAKQFDKDGDGKLSDQEKLMAQAAFQRLRNKSGGGPAYGIGYGGQAGAGGLVPNNAAGAGGEAPAPKVSALVKRFDKDGDGKLNDEEKATAQAELKKKDKKEPKAKAEKDK